MSTTLYIGITNETNLFHIGMTKRTPEERWKDDCYSKLPYIPKRVAFYDIGNNSDHDVHSLLREYGVKDLRKLGRSRSPEIFEVEGNNPIELIKSKVEQALEQLKTGIRLFSKHYTPRPHQAWVNQEILNRFDGSRTVIQPLNLAARFGKTLQALSLFKESNLKVMIVAGFWLAANESFVKTIKEGFDITSDVAIIKPDYEQFKNAIAKGQRVLIDLSLHTETNKIDSALIHDLSAYNSIIYVDEADFGAWTPSSRKTLNLFLDKGINLVCVATGTNIDRALIGTKGHIEAPITVSYLDLLEAKHGKGYLFEPGAFCSDDPQKWQDRLSDIVKLAVLKLDVGKDLIEELNDLSDEKRPNMAKIFSTRNQHISKKILTSLFIDEENGTDIFGLYATQYGSIEHPAIMMFIPGTKADVTNLVNVGKSIVPSYNWIALHGNDHSNRTAEESINSIIASGGERTVIISCCMGARSFSVPNIIAVINCKDGGSIGTAVQQASRCLTPGCGKKVGLVVDYSFNTDRSSLFETELISSSIQYSSLDTDAAIRRVHGLVNFLKKDEEGYLITLSKDDFLKYITSVENLGNMGKATIDIEGLLSNTSLLKMLENIQSNTTNDKWRGILDKAHTYVKSNNKEKNQVDPEKKAIRDLIKKINVIVDSASNVYYMAPNCNSFKDGLVEIASNPNKNAEYINLVGIGADVVHDEICNFLNLSFMDLIILRADNCDFQHNFNFSSEDHPSNLFNPEISNSRNTIYIAKEPGRGVLDDLSKSKGKIVVVDSLGAYSDYYCKIGYNCISNDEYKNLKTMPSNPYNSLGNPPFQALKTKGKTGKGGNNSLYIKFIKNAIKKSKGGGFVSQITPPAAILKSTILKQPTLILKMMTECGSLDWIDLSDTVGKHFNVGTPTSRWYFTDGKTQGKVKVIHSDCVEYCDIEDLYYLPPVSTKIERNLYKKIINNTDGDVLIVVRGQKNQDCTMERFGYPKVQIGGSGVLGFEQKFYDFMSSKTGLWLLDYVRRHDQMIYHNAISGIKIPQGGFNLTEEELELVENGNWVNFSRVKSL
jgi:hypothetical protein